jgi:hypothetical protein
MHQLLQKLEGGDRRSIGRSDEVASDVLEQPALISELVEGLFQNNPIVRMRTSDALEKATKENANHLLPFKKRLLALAETEEQIEVRWHLAQIVPRLGLTHEENLSFVKSLLSYLSGSSSIVSTSVMQAFSDIAENDEELKGELLVHIEELTVVGTPAMKARGRKLLAKHQDKGGRAVR